MADAAYQAGRIRMTNVRGFPFANTSYVWLWDVFGDQRHYLGVTDDELAALAAADARMDDGCTAIVEKAIVISSFNSVCDVFDRTGQRWEARKIDGDTWWLPPFTALHRSRLKADT